MALAVEEQDEEGVLILWVAVEERVLSATLLGKIIMVATPLAAHGEENGGKVVSGVLFAESACYCHVSNELTLSGYYLNLQPSCE